VNKLFTCFFQWLDINGVMLLTSREISLISFLIIRKAASLIFTIYKVSGYTHKVNVGGMFLALMFEAT
jgi:hypothetical protein